MAVNTQLIKDVKDYLDITWELDEAGESKLAGIVIRGMHYLDGIAGEALDYSLEETQKALLLDYVRYVRSSALDEFQSNYKSELLSLQISREVKRYDTKENTDV
nr:hypothetical protein [uncultured Aminipila sp.]